MLKARATTAVGELVAEAPTRCLSLAGSEPEDMRMLLQTEEQEVGIT